MLTSKERATLRGIASTQETIGQIGKDGLTDTIIKEVDLALRARELVKYRVLESCELTAREVADTLQKKTNSNVVQVVGSRFVLYKKNPKKPVVKL